MDYYMYCHFKAFGDDVNPTKTQGLLQINLYAGAVQCQSRCTLLWTLGLTAVGWQEDWWSLERSKISCRLEVKSCKF